VTSPLRIGILGAARIADEGIVAPAEALGHELVAIAARDRQRAEAFADAKGVRRVHDSYAEVISDPDVDLVYNALVNSLHTRWNLAALEAGKHVLSEKPLATNAEEARTVQAAAAEATGWIVEGFHYIHHPVNARLKELVTSGALGDIQSVDLVLSIPSPSGADPRWSAALGGGATMDLGCYVLDAARRFGTWIGATPDIAHVEATMRSPDVDAAMRVDLDYGRGVTGRCLWDMDADDRTMTWTVTGALGVATSPAFAVPHLDNRVVVSQHGCVVEEIHGNATSYTYQLAHIADVLRAGPRYPAEVEGSVANAELIDECYRLAGLAPRGKRPGKPPTAAAADD
jgi:predicted dehydrogenase